MPSSRRARVRSPRHGGPVVVEVAVDTELVGRGGGGGGHDVAPAGAVRDPMLRTRERLRRRRAGRRMTHSATARLMTQAAPLARSPRTSPVPKMASPKPSVNTWVPAPEPEGVGPDHPGPVRGDVAAADGGEPEHQARGHRGDEDEPEHVQQVAGAGLGLVEQGQPQRRPGHQRARRRRRPGPPGGARPGDCGGSGARTGTSRRARTRRRRRCGRRPAAREAGEPVVGRHQVRSAGELDQPQGAGRERDGGQRQQRGRDRPAPRLGPAPASRVVAVAGWVVIGPGWARRGHWSRSVPASVRVWVRHREMPRPISAMPVGDGHRPVERVRQHREHGRSRWCRQRAARPPSGPGRRRGTGRCRRCRPPTMYPIPEAANTPCIRPMSPTGLPPSAATRRSLDVRRVRCRPASGGRTRRRTRCPR